MLLLVHFAGVLKEQDREKHLSVQRQASKPAGTSRYPEHLDYQRNFPERLCASACRQGIGFCKVECIT